MNLISKRLLDEVMETITFDIVHENPEYEGLRDNSYIEGDFTKYSIGHEGEVETWYKSESSLVHDCKKHFVDYGNSYCISSFIDFDGTWFANVTGFVFKQSFQGLSESEAVFKACEWCMVYEEAFAKIEKDAEIEEDYGSSDV